MNYQPMQGLFMELEAVIKVMDACECLELDLDEPFIFEAFEEYVPNQIISQDPLNTDPPIKCLAYRNNK